MNEIYLKLYMGFGDNLYQIPFVHAFAQKYKKVYLRTPFPFLYQHLPNVEFVRPHTKLYTCKQAMTAYDFISEGNVHGIKTIQPHYQTNHKQNVSMIDSFMSDIPIPRPIDWKLYLNPEWVREASKIIREINTNKQICIIKQPSIRNDWDNPARLCDTKYMRLLINEYRDKYHFISIADYNNEKPIGLLHGIDTKFNHGELSLPVILALVAQADLVIGCHTFIIAAGIVTETPTFCLYGGFKKPELWLLPEETRGKYGWVAPEPFCNCQDRKHGCNKHMDNDRVIKTFDDFINQQEGQVFEPVVAEDKPSVPNKPRGKKKNLLLVRLNHPERCAKYAHNEAIYNEFNVHVLEHRNVGEYSNFSNRFSSATQYPSIGNICFPKVTPENKTMVNRFITNLLDSHNIDTVINSQPLHPYNEWMGNICKQRGLNVINTEMGLDDKMIFDRVGSQYTRDNEINQFVELIDASKKTQLPQSTRQPQPDKLNRGQFFNKYSLVPNKEYVVVLGQLAWDMSVKQSMNPRYSQYMDYWNQILRDKKQLFIVKCHPLYLKGGRNKDIQFLRKYQNVKLVNESLETLFDLFDYYTSFSSTTIFEGLLKRKKFATMGYHFCNNDNLVLQLRDKPMNLLSQLKELRVDEELLKKYIHFVTNYYMVDLESEQLYHRITMSSEEYFKQRW